MLSLFKFSFILLVVLHLFFMSTKKHLLAALLSLEAMVLILLIFSLSISFMILEGLNLYLFILTLSVSEAALGLALLMSYVKLKGSDLISSTNSLK
uniref:NADH-ubiquinone oxidoreductase chain 4L n=1 Tax=Zaptyx pattalus TaxID=1885785 RepID=A0A224ABB5_9EUPU|nr:NADH dehydrogenase subunit 4L [Zaptyx pattalus]